MAQGDSRNIPNHLVPAILVTLFCCLPLGIISIVYAAQVNGKIAQGDIDGARQSSENAKKYYMMGMIIGIVINVIVVIAQIVMVSTMSTQLPQ